jgi:hypothetical protein
MSFILKNDRLILLLLLLVALRGASYGQIIELRGGDSTMFGAGGGNAILHFPKSTETFGAGIADGHFHFGVSSSFDWQKWNVTAGDDYLSLVTGTGLVVPIRGLTTERRWKKQKLTLFAGAAGQFYSFPYFSATSVHHFGSGMLYQNKLPHGLDFSLMGVIVGSQRTEVGSLHYLWKGLDAAGTAGLLQSQPFGKGGVSYKPIQALSFFATRQDYFFDLRQTSTVGSSSVVQAATTINSVGGSATLKGLSLSASALTGSTGTNQVSGQTFGGSVHPGPLVITTSYYRSPHSSFIASSFTEKLSRRWSVSEFLTYSQGHWSVNYGGSFTSNRLTASVGYLTNFVPYSLGASPFQQTISVSVSWQLPHSTTVTVATNTLPDGAVRWSTYGNSYVQGPLQSGDTIGGMAHTSQSRLGAKFIIRGIVRDTSGRPVAGAAVLVGKEMEFTDFDGTFFVRLRKAKTVAVKVVPDDFRAPGNWRVVSAPERATSEPTDKETTINIEVSREM